MRLLNKRSPLLLNGWQCLQGFVYLQPPHFRFINLLTKHPGLPMHFLALHPVNRGIERRISELGIQRRLFLIPLGQLPLKLLNLFD
jgi:hypothetical protein